MTDAGLSVLTCEPEPPTEVGGDDVHTAEY
jgi:hypothetical protein